MSAASHREEGRCRWKVEYNISNTNNNNKILCNTNISYNERDKFNSVRAEIVNLVSIILQVSIIRPMPSARVRKRGFLFEEYSGLQ